MQEICPACRQPLDIRNAAICYSCFYLIHPECIVKGSQVCQNCWFTGMCCKKSNCFAYHSGICLADRCQGVVDCVAMSEILHIEKDAYSVMERAYLYRQLHRQFYSDAGALSRAKAGEMIACPHMDCLAYEKKLCLASMCFGSIVLPKVAPIVVRAQIYDDYALKDIAIRKAGTRYYHMTCSRCGCSIRCSGDAARHFLLFQKEPLCTACRSEMR